MQRATLPLHPRRAQRRADDAHRSEQDCESNGSLNLDKLNDDSSSIRPAASLSPPKTYPASVRFRMRRGGTPGESTIAAPPPESAPGNYDWQPLEIELNRGGGEVGTIGDLDAPQDLGDLLFLARSSQPGSIGAELQRRGVRFFPQEAFFDDGDDEGEGEGEAAAGEEDGLSGFTWAAGEPLPRSLSMGELPGAEEGRARVVLWDPCGEKKSGVVWFRRFLALSDRPR